MLNFRFAVRVLAALAALLLLPLSPRPRTDMRSSLCADEAGMCDAEPNSFCYATTIPQADAIWVKTP